MKQVTFRLLTQPVPSCCVCAWCEQPAVAVKQWKTGLMPVSAFSYSCLKHISKLLTLKETDMFTISYSVGGKTGTNIVTSVDKAVRLVLLLRRQGAKNLIIRRTVESYGPTRQECRRMAVRI